MSKLKPISELTDDELLKMLSALHPSDYNHIANLARTHYVGEAVMYLRFHALDRVPDLINATYFVKAVQHFESL